MAVSSNALFSCQDVMQHGIFPYIPDEEVEHFGKINKLAHKIVAQEYNDFRKLEKGSTELEIPLGKNYLVWIGKENKLANIALTGAWSALPNTLKKCARLTRLDLTGADVKDLDLLGALPVKHLKISNLRKYSCSFPDKNKSGEAIDISVDWTLGAPAKTPERRGYLQTPLVEPRKSRGKSRSGSLRRREEYSLINSNPSPSNDPSDFSASACKSQSGAVGKSFLDCVDSRGLPPLFGKSTGAKNNGLGLVPQEPPILDSGVSLPSCGRRGRVRRNLMSDFPKD